MSKLIKATQYFTLDDIKLIEFEARQRKLAISSASTPEAVPDTQSQEIERLREQLLRDAEAMAEARLLEAAEQAEALRQQAVQEIESWWEAKRLEDEQATAEARQMGYETGFQQGTAQAERNVREEYAGMLEEARMILEQASALKQTIIQEAEPFLVELSCGIAEKIIQRQLALSPEWAADMAKTVLSRRRERGLITLCVAPQHFALFQEAREELMATVDPQGELQIIPDPTVADFGCVIRSSFGSIDARIDTQLKEIKSALRQIAFTEEGADFDG